MDTKDKSVKEFLQEGGDLQNNAITVTKKLLEGGKEEVTLNLSRTNVLPERMESPPREHICHEAMTFASIVKKNATENTLILIDVGHEKVSAILDDKADKGFEIITLQPALDPRFEVLQNTLLNKNLPPKEFAIAVLVNRNSIITADFENNRNLPMLLKQMTVANKITAHEGVGNQAVNGLLCETEIRAGKGTEEIVLPDEIAVETPIYLATEIKRFKIQITVIPVNATNVRIQTISPEADLCKFEVFQKMIEPLKEIENILTGYGSPKYGSWQYNR